MGFSAFAGSEWKRAKKPHVCRKCKQAIRVRDRYWQDVSDVAPDENPERFCAKCANQMGLPELTQ